MQNNPICTSVEQSQRLIGLRLDVNKADLYYNSVGIVSHDLHFLHPKYPKECLTAFQHGLYLH